jgi:hypothetical protein
MTPGEALANPQIRVYSVFKIKTTQRDRQMPALDKISGTPEVGLPNAWEGKDWFKVTVRTPGGKAHRAYAEDSGHIVQMSCSCPGSQNGSLRKKCYLVANGWDKSNCGN